MADKKETKFEVEVAKETGASGADRIVEGQALAFEEDDVDVVVHDLSHVVQGTSAESQQRIDQHAASASAAQAMRSPNRPPDATPISSQQAAVVQASIDEREAPAVEARNDEKYETVEATNEQQQDVIEAEQEEEREDEDEETDKEGEAFD